MGHDFPESIRWQDCELWLLDQTRLPHHVVYEKQETAHQLFESIHQLKVRGAPAIGIAAAYGVSSLMREHADKPLTEFKNAFSVLTDYVNSSRPTAVNLKWALDRLTHCLTRSKAINSQELLQELMREAEAIHLEDKNLCLGIGEHALPLIEEGFGVMTHCNAGALATGGIGTATAPLYLAHERGISFRVYANETRPLLQGSRLTSWELHCAGIDVTLITDNMAAQTLASGAVNLVIVGTDRVAANGDVANKIGTLGVAILAKHYGIPFYVACPSSTIDLTTESGAAIPIEQRDSHEVRHFGEHKATVDEIKTLNPAFDVTPAELVTGIITEKGIIRPPFAEGLRTVLNS